jgi:hypothetical protein
MCASRASAPGNTAALASEKLNSTTVAPKPRMAVAWGPVVGKVSIALKEQASAARASAWAKTVEKLRSRQMALKERVATARTAAGMVSEFDRI